MPLIAWAYIAYACGSFTGFLAPAHWTVAAVCAGLAAAAVSALLRGTTAFSIALLFVSGALIAHATPDPPPRWARPADALAPARSALTARVDRTFGPDSAIARALLVADQRQIPIDVRDRYASAGLVHMLSISGLHVAIIAAAIELLLLAARVSRAGATAATIGIVTAYVAVLGWPPPAVRSAVMYGVVAAGQRVQRPTSPWAVLALGAWLPLVSPRTILDIGYQLSVGGMAALTASGIVTRRYMPADTPPARARLARDLFASTLASVASTPIVLWYFGKTSLVAPAANLFAGPVMAVLQPTLFLALSLSWLPAAAKFVADAAHPLIVAFDWIAIASARAPFAAVDHAPTLLSAVCMGVGTAALLAACAARRPGRMLVACTAAFCAALWMPSLPARRGVVELHVLDVGQGDALGVRTGRGNWILFDAGDAWRTGDAGRAVVTPYVRRRGGSVHALVLTHPHADHVGGAASVIRWLRPRAVYDPAYVGTSPSYAAALAAAERYGAAWRRARPGERIELDGLVVAFLAPDSAWAASLRDPNEASVVARVSYGDVDFLLTGDAERDAEGWLLSRDRGALDVEVLKLGHHGSRTSTTEPFLDATSPKLAVISVGADNAYGHPGGEVLGRLSRRRVPVLRTDRDGAIVVATDGAAIRVRAGGDEWVLPSDSAPRFLDSRSSCRRRC